VWCSIIIYESIRYWKILDEYFKILLFFLVIVLLIYLGYKKLDKKQRSSV